jgi:hypothetical protein
MEKGAVPVEAAPFLFSPGRSQAVPATLKIKRRQQPVHLNSHTHAMWKGKHHHAAKRIGAVCKPISRRGDRATSHSGIYRERHADLCRHPLKALVAEDANGKTSVTYNDPEYLRDRHNVPADLIKNLAGAGALIAKAVE